MSTDKRRLWAVCALSLLACNLTAKKSGGGESTGGGEDAPAAVALDAPASNPPERDDARAPLLRVVLAGSKARPVAVPYVYGYPLYAEGAALQGLRMLRHENWVGYAREQFADPQGVTHVVEAFPSLGCRFEGVQQDDETYVPLRMLCDVPPPKERGAGRPVVGALSAKTKLDEVPAEPSLKKAFLGEWHAVTEAPDGGETIGYFDVPHGLLGFVFDRGRLTSIAFLFDPPDKRWRNPELWKAPLDYTVGP
jgi:hypothetical protein